MTEDYGVFLDTDEFADEVVNVSKGFSFNAIFNNGYYDADGAETTLPTFICETSIVDVNEQGDILEHLDIEYEIRSVQNDGTGMGVIVTHAV